MSDNYTNNTSNFNESTGDVTQGEDVSTQSNPNTETGTQHNDPVSTFVEPTAHAPVAKATTYNEATTQNSAPTNTYGEAVTHNNVSNTTPTNNYSETTESNNSQAYTQATTTSDSATQPMSTTTTQPHQQNPSVTTTQVTNQQANSNIGDGINTPNAAPDAVVEDEPTKPQDIKGKKVMVVGLGRTGVALSKFLVSKGANVTISDHKSKAELVNYLELMEDVDINYDLGGHTPKLFLQQDLLILSPGISPYLKIFDYARSRGVHVTGEFEFASSFIEEPIIAVTGTNGKSTVCKMIHQMLAVSGVSNWLGGNYGAPLSEYLMLEEKPQIVIAEVSSFQLEHASTFKPKNIVFTNLAENHLDRYKTMEEYVNAKRKIFLNTHQKTTSILNADDNAVVELARDPSVQRGRIFYFSRKEALEPQIMNIGGVVYKQGELKLRRSQDIDTFNVRDCKMKGNHTYENIMASSLAALENGATKEAVQQVIDTYRGLDHRLEYVRRVGGVEFYNDSKATNVHAVMRALDAFDDNIILIMGGKDTSLNYEPLKDRVRRKVKNLILTGESKERINRHIGDFSETFLIGTFEEAIHMAYQKSRIGDLILMSPGCSSFDVFDSYVERGNYFKEMVNKFK